MYGNIPDARRVRRGRQSAARRVDGSPRSSAIHADHERALQTGFRAGRARGSRRHRRDRRQRPSPDIRQYDRGARVQRPSSGPHLQYFLQPERGAYERYDAGSRAGAFAHADRVQQRRKPRSEAVRPGQGGLRSAGVAGAERRTEAIARKDLQGVRPQRRGPFRRRQEDIPRTDRPPLGAEPSVQPKLAGGHECLYASCDRSGRRRGVARLRPRGHGGRGQGARARRMGRHAADSQHGPVYDLFVESRPEREALAGL